MQAYIRWIVSYVVLPQSRRARFILVEYTRVDHLPKRVFCSMLLLWNVSPPCKGVRISSFLIFSFRNRNPGKIFLVESRIPLTIGIQKTSSTNKKNVQYVESGIKGVESRIQQYIGFPHMGQRHRAGPSYRKKNLQKGNRRNKTQWYDKRLPQGTMVPKFKSFLDMKNYQKCPCWSTVEQRIMTKWLQELCKNTAQRNTWIPEYRIKN